MGEMSMHCSAPNLTGHLGYLTKEQETSFVKFKHNLARNNLYTPPTNTTRASHDDDTILRFLRSRKFDLVKAQVKFAGTQAWRKEHNVSKLFADVDHAEFEASKRFYPRWTGRRNKHGVPVYVYRLASLTGPLREELDSLPQKRRFQRMVPLFEIMTRFVTPLCSYLPHPTAPAPISSVMTIIDLEKMTISSLWAMRSHLQQATKLATDNYPETMNTIVVVNSPPFFLTLWSCVKNWFEEGTQNKVHILGQESDPVLRSLVDSRHLPKRYGGELQWKFEDEPYLDDEAKKVIGEMPTGPVTFVDGAVVRPQLEELNRKAM